MTSPKPATRLVQPKTMVFDGLRWHLRAFSVSHQEYRDFVLARICSATSKGQLDAPHPVDTAWENIKTVKIGPHPGLSNSQKMAVERDYGVTDGYFSTPVRAALLSYFLLALRIGEDDLERAAMSQQIVLLNRDELKPFIYFK